MATAIQIPFIIKPPRLKVRLLRAAEVIPEELNAAFDQLRAIDPSWVWVATQGENIVGVLIAGPVHGLAILWRICAAPTAPRTVIISLLRKSLADMYQRGYIGYMVMLDLSRAEEKKLSQIVLKSGGHLMGGGLLFAGKTDLGGL